MENKSVGKQSFTFEKPPVITAWASVAGKKEKEGPLGESFDFTHKDAYFGQKSWEQGEKRMQQLRTALNLHRVRLSRNTLDQMWLYCAAMLEASKASPAEVFDLAFSQKALPCILAEAPVECLKELKTMLADMPRSLALLEAPLPILI